MKHLKRQLLNLSNCLWDVSELSLLKGFVLLAQATSWALAGGKGEDWSLMELGNCSHSRSREQPPSLRQTR